MKKISETSTQIIFEVPIMGLPIRYLKEKCSNEVMIDMNDLAKLLDHAKSQGQKSVQDVFATANNYCEIIKESSIEKINSNAKTTI